MEKQLAEYRAKKAEATEQKWCISNALFSSKSDKVIKYEETRHKSTKSQEYVVMYPRLRAFLTIALWWCCLGFFTHVGFGSVFFVLSLFYFMYVSMKSGTRHPWEPSAYSVFNENCDAIDGTLSAKQFENELKFGARSVGW